MNSPSDFIEALKQRGSVRDFKTDAIDDAALQAILDAARQSPSSCHMQTYSIITVRDQAKKVRLAELAGGQKHIEQVPVFLLFVADLARLKKISELKGAEFEPSTFEQFIVSTLDASIAGMTASIAAESMGLGTVMIGGMRNHPEKVAELLDLPPLCYVVYGLCIGWPVKPSKPKPRLPRALVIHEEAYRQANDAALIDKLDQYDKILDSHHRQMDYDADLWSERVTKLVESRRRSDIVDILRAMGFHF